MAKDKVKKDNVEKDKHKRRMDGKWKSLKARGFKRPKDEEENRQRAYESHRS